MKKISLLLLAPLVLFASCKKEEDEDTTTSSSNSKTVEMSITGLADLGTDYVYEGWIIVGGSPISTGTFTVDGSGTLSKTSFSASKSDVDAATKFVLSIEPSVDPDPKPSAVKILSGEIASGSAVLSVDGTVADLSTVAGGYILATPTNGNNNDENSGVWFLDPSGPAAALTLPVLPSGWEYEGWAVIDGTPVTTGKFSSTSGSDDSAPFSGTTASGPAFPGEDFLLNAPSGLTFPTDLSGKKIVISIEPVPDNSASPFLLKPLVGTVPTGAADHTLYTLGQNLSTSPTGTIVVK